MCGCKLCAAQSLGIALALELHLSLNCTCLGSALAAPPSAHIRSLAAPCQPPMPTPQAARGAHKQGQRQAAPAAVPFILTMLFFPTSRRLHAVRTSKGGGKPLMLLVHGFPEAWFSWRAQMAAFWCAVPAALCCAVHGVLCCLFSFGRVTHDGNSSHGSANRDELEAVVIDMRV